MAGKTPLRIAVVGLEFGRNFLPSYLAHPHVGEVGICDVDPATLGKVAEQFGITDRHTSLKQVIESGQYDAVNLFTPIPQHAEQAVAALDAGLHVASAVPMATSIDDLRAIVAAQKRSGRNYMMMETSAATDEFFYVRDMLEAGDLGRIQFMRGRFYHNLENHPRYWHGLPPMHYITHPLGPILALAKTRVASVCCFGSGSMREALHEEYGNPYPVQTAIFRLHESDIAVEVTSITFETAVQPKETFDLYGSRRSFVWANFYGEDHALLEWHEPRPNGPKTGPHTLYRMKARRAHDRLPEALRRVMPAGPYPQLVDEFVMSIVEARSPRIDAITAADWTAPGLCAHESAMAGGKVIEVPSFG